jgi:hypothetical protein
MSLMGNTSSGAVRIYQITYLFGLALGLTLYLLVNKLFPPPGLGVSEDFDDNVIITDGVEMSSDGQSPEKETAMFDKQVLEDSKA